MSIKRVKKYISSIIESNYYRNAFTLISGSAVAQAVLLLMLPILTRLFTPDDFGLYASFLAVTGILSILASLRYELAILLPEKEVDGLRVFMLASLFSLFFSCVLLLFIPWLSQWNWLKSLVDVDDTIVFFLLPLGIVLYNLTKTSSYLANRIKAYKWLSYSRVSGGITTGVASIVFGLFGFVGLGLLFGKIIGWIVEVFVALFPARHKIRAVIPQTSLENLKVLAVKYRNFPKFSTPEGLLNVGFKQMPILLLTAWFSMELAGIYSLAFALLSKPMGMVSSAFGQIFFQEAASMDKENKGAVQKLFINNLLFLIRLALLPCIAVAFVAPQLFTFILGDGYEMTGVFVRWLMPFSFITFLKGPFSAMTDIKNKIGRNIFFEMAFFSLTLISFYMGFYFDNVLLGIKIFSFSSTLLGVFQLYWFYSLTKLDGGWG